MTTPQRQQARQLPGSRIEIGKLAAWSVSSFKPEHGQNLLRDDDLSTYWQSDAAPPHYITMKFEKKTTILQIAFYCDVKLDESYTPIKVSVRAGTGHHDLKELKLVELDEAPIGWTEINLETSPGQPPKVFVLQLAILSNHLNGKDSHLRQVKVFASRKPVDDSDDFEKPFTAIEFIQHATLR